MTTPRLVLMLGGLALLALLVVGLARLSTHSATPARSQALTPGQLRARLAGSPAPLAALHAEANQLLTGGKHALRTRLAELRGRPLVINKWASWCVPCRSEFGSFQRTSVELGRRVAFIGIDSGDAGRDDAAAFLRHHPVSYPSYYDPSGSLGTAITQSSSMPVTVFYDPEGRQYIHQGPYLSARALRSDVERYALDA